MAETEAAPDRPLIVDDECEQEDVESESESNLSFQPPDSEFIEPKTDEPKVLDETIELLKSRPKVCKVDALVEDIIEASGNSSTTAATKDTREYFFEYDEEPESENDEELPKSLNSDAKDEEEDEKNSALETDEEYLENITEELNIVANHVLDEQNTLELLQATLDEPISNDIHMIPDLPEDIDSQIINGECLEVPLAESDADTERVLKQVFGDENKDFIAQLSYNIAKHNLKESSGRHDVRGSFSSMDVNMDSQDGQEEINEENETNDENQDPNTPAHTKDSVPIQNATNEQAVVV